MQNVGITMRFGSYHTLLLLTSGCSGLFGTTPDRGVSAPDLSLAPLASAGPDQEVLGGTRVTLLGRGSYHPAGLPIQARWEQLAGEPVLLSNITDLSPSFVAPLAAQTLQFRLIVEDGLARTSDEVALRVGPAESARAPRVVAGPDRLLRFDQLASLDAAEVSADPGAVVAIEEVAAFDAQGYPVSVDATIFKVTAVLGDLAAAPDYVLLFAADLEEPGAQAPTARLTAPALVAPGGSVRLSGEATDTNGDTTRLRWEQLDGEPVTLGSAGRIDFVAPRRPQTLLFRLHARDALFESAPADVAVVVAPPAGATIPTVSPRLDGQTHAGNEVLLDARPDFGPDVVPGTGSVLWQQTVGPGVDTTVLDNGQLLGWTAPAAPSRLAFVAFARTDELDGPPAVVTVDVVPESTNTAPGVYLCASSLAPAPGQIVLITATVVDWESDIIAAASLIWSATFNPLANASPLSAKDPSTVPRAALCSPPLPVPLIAAPWTAVLAQELTAPVAGTTVDLSLAACDALAACSSGALSIATPP